MSKACDVVDAVDVSYAMLDVWAWRVRCRMQSDCVVTRKCDLFSSGRRYLKVNLSQSCESHEYHKVGEGKNMDYKSGKDMIFSLEIRGGSTEEQGWSIDPSNL
ncbi:hypothetical protein L3X38_022618 [Prunus dulcis]|uniref:Uncharacterized protein n=1 Tax=Prunus dulcis TaxID=3755 RepID=A0AAD4VW99_PRUDU|nr:hypothetical protein L3X38_022618 [Prunus dulcis]